MTNCSAEWPHDINEIIRHLGTVEIDLDDYDVQVDSCLPSRNTPLGEYSASLSRTLDLDEHPALRQAVDKVVAEVATILRKGDPEHRPDRCKTCVNSDCCSMGRIFLSHEEAGRILNFIGAEESAITTYFEKEKDIAGAYDYIFKHQDGHCPFLDQTGDQSRCSVYDVRPRVCREFDAAACDECEEEMDLD